VFNRCDGRVCVLYMVVSPLTTNFSLLCLVTPHSKTSTIRSISLKMRSHTGYTHPNLPVDSQSRSSLHSRDKPIMFLSPDPGQSNFLVIKNAVSTSKYPPMVPLHRTLPTLIKPRYIAFSLVNVVSCGSPQSREMVLRS